MLPITYLAVPQVQFLVNTCKPFKQLLVKMILNGKDRCSHY